MFIEAENLKTIIVSVNKDSVNEYNRVVEEAREKGIVNIYSSEYIDKLRELENFMNITHVLNGVIERYIEIIKLRDEEPKGEN